MPIAVSIRALNTPHINYKKQGNFFRLTEVGCEFMGVCHLKFSLGNADKTVMVPTRAVAQKVR